MLVRDFMKHMQYTALSTALFMSALLLSSSAAASSTCEELIITCFVSAPAERDECIQTAAAYSACETSRIHSLVAKRAQFATMKQIPEEGPSFLGPQIVDRRCVTKFDTTWSASLVNGSGSQESLNSLSAALDECAKGEGPVFPLL